jgi:hypothetical protein
MQTADLSTPLLALYQGTTLVVPQTFETKLALAPAIVKPARNSTEKKAGAKESA